VVGTFGRGIYVLDDLTPLRVAKPADFEQPAMTFPVKAVAGYIPSSTIGGRGKAFLGESLFTAPNPPYGAVFTYYLKDAPKTRKQARVAAEKDAEKKGELVKYPTRDDFLAESREEAPSVIATVTDASGSVVRRISAPARAGVQRIAWNLRYPSSTPTSNRPAPDNPFFEPPSGPMVVPGAYKVSFTLRADGKETTLGTPQSFEVTSMNLGSLPAADKAQLLAFQQKVASLQRAVLGAEGAAREAQERIDLLKRAVEDTPAIDPRVGGELRAIEARLKDIQVALSGDSVMERRNEAVPMSIDDRVSAIVRSHWNSTTAPTGTNVRAYEIAADEFATQLEKLRQVIDADLKKLEGAVEAAGGPWTPGRVPVWKK
jgi:hypothetical protein